MQAKYSWHPVYNLVMKIKHDYEQTFGPIDEYNLEKWMEKLDKQEYNEWKESLQFTKWNEFVLVRYGLAEMQSGMWTDPNSIFRECRSVVIDLKEEELVLTPFRKFFNLNETEENKLEKVVEELKNAKVVEVTNKLDGSMQVARAYHGKIFMSGSQALDPKNSWRLADGISRLTDNHKLMINENPNWTFIFEYITLMDAHVVKYKSEDEGLYLIGIRDITTGEQFTYDRVKSIANQYQVPMTTIEKLTIEEALEMAKNVSSDEKEGWVLNIDGHYIKLKADDYTKVHRMLDRISSINVIIQNIADETYDDLMAKVPDVYKPRVEKVAKLIFDYKRQTEADIRKYYKMAPKEDKKEFMLWVSKNAPKNIAGYVKEEFLGRPYNVLKAGPKNAPRYKKLVDMGYRENYSALFVSEE